MCILSRRRILKENIGWRLNLNGQEQIKMNLSKKKTSRWQDDPAGEEVAAYIRNAMLRRKGSLSQNEISQLLSNFGFPLMYFPTLIKNQKSYFYACDDGTIYPWSRLKVCKNYIGEGCDDPLCGYLHLCKMFIVWNNCPHSDMCMFSHDISECSGLFRIHNFNGVTIEDIRYLFQVMEEKMFDKRRKLPDLENNEVIAQTFKASQLRKMLLEQGGVTTYAGLFDLALGSKLDISNLSDFLDQNDEYFKHHDDGNIVAWTSLRICRQHLYEVGGCRIRDCRSLHICKHYLVFCDCFNDGDTCRFGHALNEIGLLQRHNLLDLSFSMISLLFQLTHNVVPHQVPSTPPKSQAELVEDLQKMLLAEGGKVSWEHFKELMEKVGVTETDPEKYLDDYRGNFHVVKSGDVIAWTTLKVCNTYNRRVCDNVVCRGLHVCIEHLNSKCSACGRCHNVFQGGHNLDLLTQHNLDMLTLPEIRQLYQVVHLTEEEEEMEALIAFAEEEILAKNVRKKILNEGGEVSESRVVDIIKELNGEAPKLKMFIQQYPKYLRYIRRGPHSGNNLRIMAWTDLPVCHHYMFSQDGCSVEHCGGIHVCRLHLYMDGCRLQTTNSCKFSHALLESDNHNFELLKSHELEEMTLSELRTLFQTLKTVRIEGSCLKDIAEVKKAKDLRKLLLEHEGNVSKAKLLQLASKVGIEESEVNQLLEKKDYINTDTDNRLVPWTALQLCKAYGFGREGCPTKKCRKLHVCYRHMLESGCCYDDNPRECLRSHNLEKDDHNHHLLERYGLDDTPFTLLRKLYTYIDDVLAERKKKKVPTATLR